MRVIGGLRFDFALGATWLGATDRGNARRLCRGRRRKRVCRCFGLRATAAGASRMPRFALAALGRTRLAFSALVATISGGARLALTPRLAAAARPFP